MTQNQVRALNAQLYFLACWLGGWKGLLGIFLVHISSLTWNMTIPQAIKYFRKEEL